MLTTVHQSALNVDVDGDGDVEGDQDDTVCSHEELHNIELHTCIHTYIPSLSGQDLVSDIFDKIHFFVQMDS